ncbi:methyltransferase domain-containing protein [Brenneria uluponensis]|uniref:methyltransferase domain-containing protein n=1 Tax=Brenneria uluponensis TaxID=3057057 RepID=UPI0028E31C75|nr:methyltransferase domain-containing protein [Brenneria ulupoensis]
MDLSVGNEIKKSNANWNFGGDVPKHFVEHIRSSVPLYDDGHELICLLSDFFCKNDSTCYEIGSSTGQLIKKLAQYNNAKPNIKWVGIDMEESMIKEARQYCQDVNNIELHLADVANYEFEKSDFIISYYTIQFLPEKLRQQLITKLYDSLNWGGALLMFEKVRAPDARFQDICATLYTDFKIKNGFSSAEIIGKMQSLKGVLNPFSTEGNLGLLKRAGFTDIISIMKYICFEGFMAIK